MIRSELPRLIAFCPSADLNIYTSSLITERLGFTIQSNKIAFSLSSVKTNRFSRLFPAFASAHAAHATLTHPALNHNERLHKRQREWLVCEMLLQESGKWKISRLIFRQYERHWHSWQRRLAVREVATTTFDESRVSGLRMFNKKLAKLVGCCVVIQLVWWIYFRLFTSLDLSFG
jgi:hypothetical protein